MNEPHGFTYEAPVVEDFEFGSSKSIEQRFGDVALVPDGNWVHWLPTTEVQSVPEFETNGCVSFGTLNIIETLRKRQFENTENLSDRFVVKGSGTLFGNTPKRVGEFIKKSWTVFENEWPFQGVKTIEEFFGTIPKNLISLAIGRGAEYDFGYELVNSQVIREALPYSPIGISVPAWFPSVSSGSAIYYRPEGAADTHWVMCYAMRDNGNYLIFDTYYPFLKELRADINPSTVMKYHLRRQIVNETYWQKFLKILADFFV